MSREVFYLVVCGVLWVVAGVLGSVAIKRLKADPDGPITVSLGAVCAVFAGIAFFFTIPAVFEFSKTLPSKVQPEVKVDAK